LSKASKSFADGRWLWRGGSAENPARAEEIETEAASAKIVIGVNRRIILF